MAKNGRGIKNNSSRSRNASLVSDYSSDEEMRKLKDSSSGGFETGEDNLAPYLLGITKEINSILKDVKDAKLKFGSFETESKEKVKAVSDEIENLRSDIEKKIEDRQIKAIEALGIFVALFTYISVSVQIFSRVSSAVSAGIFTLLFFCSLTILIIILDILLVHNSSQNFLKDIRFLLIIIFFCIAGISVFSLRYFPLNPVPSTIEFENDFQNKVNSEIENKILETTYSKEQIDIATSSMKSFKECLRINASFWPCLNN